MSKRLASQGLRILTLGLVAVMIAAVPGTALANSHTKPKFRPKIQIAITGAADVVYGFDGTLGTFQLTDGTYARFVTVGSVTSTVQQIDADGVPTLPLSIDCTGAGTATVDAETGSVSITARGGQTVCIFAN